MKRIGTWVLLGTIIGGGLLLQRRSPAQPSAPPVVAGGAVAAHLIGRLLIAADGTAQLVGYYPYIEGLPGPFFAGNPGEATAYFTFVTATPFQVQLVPNGNITHLFSNPIGDTAINVNAYYNSSPGGDFTNPGTFSSGQLIATFRARKGIGTAILGTAGLEMGTLDLISTSPFSFQGQTIDLSGLGGGITITTLVAGAPVTGNLLTPPAAIPFGGTATAIGNGITAAASSLRASRRP